MLCVIAKLDKKATEQLIEIQNTAFPAGTDHKPLYGHITLATYLGEDERDFVRFCKSALADASAFDLVYDKLEVLEETSIIVAVPAKSEPLARLHQCIAEAYGDALDIWTKGDRWYPHTTLLFGPQLDLPGIRDHMAKAFSPFAARIERIEFSRVLANAYEIVDSLDLAPCNQHSTSL